MNIDRETFIAWMERNYQIASERFYRNATP